jgi:DNA-binding GntR family transcriptional regulator
MNEPTTPRQQELLRRIIDMIHEDELQVGSRLMASRFASRLNVSRSPVRAALDRLAEDGFAQHQLNRGMVLTELPPRGIANPQEQQEDLRIVVARLKREGRLLDQFTEAELMRLTDADRSTVREALLDLENMGAVHRRHGYGWQFADMDRDGVGRLESFRFRIIVECGAILEPGFSLSSNWIASMRERHLRFIRDRWAESMSIELFEMNAEFHEGICAGSGNRYLQDAIRRQNQLRRLSNYDWFYGEERVALTCTEHLQILQWLESGDYEVAASLMRRHLTATSGRS